jgi:hypothetical protein
MASIARIQKNRIRIDLQMTSGTIAARPNGPWQVSLGNAPGDCDHRTICPERASHDSLVEPLQGSSMGEMPTWGGVHPRSWILLPQADLYEPVRLNRISVAVGEFQLNCQT